MALLVERIRRHAPVLASMYSDELGKEYPMNSDSYAPTLFGMLQSLRRILDPKNQQWFDAMLDRVTKKAIREHGLVTDRQRFFRLLDRSARPRIDD